MNDVDALPSRATIETAWSNSPALAIAVAAVQANAGATTTAAVRYRRPGGPFVDRFGHVVHDKPARPARAGTRTTFSTSASSDTNGPCTRVIRPPPCMNSMSPIPSKLLRPLFAQDRPAVELAEITWKLIRVGKFALIVPVITSTDGR